MSIFSFFALIINVLRCVCFYFLVSDNVFHLHSIYFILLNQEVWGLTDFGSLTLSKGLCADIVEILNKYMCVCI